MSLRLDRFELRAFGPFTGAVLDLQGAPGAFHLISGPNEAGKSTAQRAIGDFLFGIPARSRDDQLHDYRDMRLAAWVSDGDGRPIELVRRKGNARTLLDRHDDPVDEGMLAALLGGLSRGEFETMFSITHASLIRGGEALLAAGGGLGESLFSASLGAGSLHRIRTELTAEADRLFRPRAGSTLIMAAQSRLAAAEAQLRDSSLRANAFLENGSALEEALRERDTLAERITEARRHQLGRQRLRTLIPLVADLLAVRARLTTLADLPALAIDGPERRIRAETAIATAESALRDSTERATDVAAALAQIVETPELLAAGPGIRELAATLPGVRELETERVRHVADRELAARLAQLALEAIGSERAVADAAGLVPDAAARRRIERMLAEHERLAGTVGQANRAVNAAEQRVALRSAAAATVTETPDTAELAGALAAARAEGPLEQQGREAHERLASAEAALARALGDLAPSAEEALLASRPVPAPATVERFATDRRRLEERRLMLASRDDALAADRHQLAEDKIRLRGRGSVPTREDVIAARAERDVLWQSIRAHLGGDARVAVAPEGFEAALRGSDELADALHQHADLAAQRVELTVRELRLEADGDALATAQHQWDVDWSRHEQAWTDAWADAPVDPLTPREMDAWLRDRTVVLDRRAEVESRRRVLVDSETRRGRHEGALADALGHLAVAVPPAVTLAQLIDIGESTLTEATARMTAHADALRDLAESEARLRSDRAEAATRTEELTEWRRGWEALCAELEWGQLTPIAARDRLADLETLGTRLGEIDTAGTRIATIDQRCDRWRTAVAELVTRVALDLGEHSAAEAVAILLERLEAAVTAHDERVALQAEQVRLAVESARARTAVDGGRAQLQELIETAGVTDRDALVETERQVAQRRTLLEQAADLERQIAAAGQAPIATTVERAAGIDPDALAIEIAASEEELERLESELREHATRVTELDLERRAMESAGGGAAAGQEVAHRQAELRGLVERYLRVSVAAWALAEAIERYRREHKDPLLRRAEQLFPRLTCGSFSGLEVTYDDADEPVLVGVRPSNEHVYVEDMSTGTREQLYLALRIASLERHVELHGAMPVILDDVVLHSDPRRKRAILCALADLSRTTQVIAFSHDPGLVALAQSAIDPELLTVHTLERAQANGAAQVVESVRRAEVLGGADLPGRDEDTEPAAPRLGGLGTPATGAGLGNPQVAEVRVADVRPIRRPDADAA